MAGFLSLPAQFRAIANYPDKIGYFAHIIQIEQDFLYISQKSTQLVTGSV